MNTFYKVLPYFLFILVLGIVFLASPPIPAQEKRPVLKEEIPGKELPPEARKAAERLLQNVSVLSTSVVRFVGPVKPGTLIEERNPVPGGQIARLEVPSEPGTYYVFFIDDAPAFMFAHPVRYAWVNTKTGKVQTVDARWRPEISESGMPPSRFRLSSSETIDKVLFIFGEYAEAGTKE